MATIQRGKDGKKGTVEDAANALKNNKAATDNKNTGDNANAGDGNQAGSQEAGTDDKNAGSSSSEGVDTGSEKIDGGDTSSARMTIQLPTPEAIENAANQFADNPELLEAAERTVNRAKEIIATRNQPPAKTAEEVEAEYHQKLVKIYGKDYVTAKRNGSQGYFSRLTWNNLGKAKNGWVEQSKTMPEVAASETETEK